MRTGLLLSGLLCAAPAALADATPPVPKDAPAKDPGTKDPGKGGDGKVAPDATPKNRPKVGVVRRPIGRAPAPVRGIVQENPPHKVGIVEEEAHAPVVGTVRQPDQPGTPPSNTGTAVGTQAEVPVGTTAEGASGDGKHPAKKPKPAHGAPPKP